MLNQFSVHSNKLLRISLKRKKALRNEINARNDKPIAGIKTFIASLNEPGAGNNEKFARKKSLNARNKNKIAGNIIFIAFSKNKIAGNIIFIAFSKHKIARLSNDKFRYVNSRLSLLSYFIEKIPVLSENFLTRNKLSHRIRQFQKSK